MGMACGLESGSCSAEDLKVARSLVPKALEPYVTGQPPRWGQLGPAPAAESRGRVGLQDAVWRGHGLGRTGRRPQGQAAVHAWCSEQVLRQVSPSRGGPGPVGAVAAVGLSPG